MGTYILVALCCGLLTYTIADKRSLKNPILWGIGGAIFTVIAIGAVTFAKKKI
jgi:hypothetical protein